MENYFEKVAFSGRKPDNIVQSRVRVRLDGDFELIGYLSYPGNSFFSRVTDLLNDSRQFIPLVDVEVYRGGRRLYQGAVPFIALRKTAVLFLLEVPSS